MKHKCEFHPTGKILFERMYEWMCECGKTKLVKNLGGYSYSKPRNKCPSGKTTELPTPDTERPSERSFKDSKQRDDEE